MPTNQQPTTPMMATPNDARTSTPTPAIAAAPKTLTINQVKRALLAAAVRIHGPLKGRR